MEFDGVRWTSMNKRDLRLNIPGSSRIMMDGALRQAPLWGLFVVWAEFWIMEYGL